jgi:hypothetical protein
MHRSAGVPSEQRSVERAVVLQLLGEDHDPRWSFSELCELGDPEPVLVAALARLREDGVVIGEGDALFASPCARRLDALGVIAI